MKIKQINKGGQKIVAMRGRNIVNGKRKDYLNAPTIQRLEVNENDESNCLTGVQKDNLVLTHYGHLNKTVQVSEISPTLKANSHGHEPMIIHKTGGYTTTFKQGTTGTLQSGGANVMDKVPNIVVSSPNHGRAKGREYQNETPTLQSQMGTGGDNIPYVNNIRRLTERECEALQGFPKDWTKFGNYDGVTKEISRTQRYKLCGNAVTKDIVELIGRKLLEK